MLEFIKSFIEKKIQEVPEFIKFILGTHPELVEAAKEKDLVQVEELLEKHFNKQSMSAWIEETLFNPQRAWKGMFPAQIFLKEVEKDGLSEELVKLMKKFVVLLAKHRRVNLESMCNMLQVNFDTPKELEEFLGFVVKSGLCKVQNGTFIAQEWFTLSQHEENILDLRVSNLPMVCQPRNPFITSSGDVQNGYLHLKKNAFTKHTESPHTEVPFDFLKKSSFKYQLNYEFWYRYGIYHPEIPSQEPGEDDRDFKNKVKDSLRQHFKKMMVVELFKQLGIQDIWFVTSFDFRGRNYPTAYLFNPQGSDLDKALLKMEPQKLTEEGYKWFLVSLANNWNTEVKGKALDKHCFDLRTRIVEQLLVPITRNDYETFLDKAEELANSAECPCNFMAHMMELWKIRDAYSKGEVPETGIIAHFDATSSGYQLVATFFKDMEIARMSNVIGDERNDLYSIITDKFRENGLPSNFSRSFIKKGICIPFIYGSIRCVSENFESEEHQKIINDTLMSYKALKGSRQLIDLWNKSWFHYSFHLPDGFKVYKQIMNQQGYAIKIFDQDVIIYKKINEPREHSVELAPNITHACDGFFAREITRAFTWKPEWKSWLLKLFQTPAWHTHKEDEKGSRAKMEKLIKLAKTFNFWSLVILSEITPANIDLVPRDKFVYLFNSLSSTPGNVSEIHDSFGVHPNLAKELMDQYRRLLRDLARSRYLEAVLDELLGHPEGYLNFTPATKEFIQQIEESKYALC